MLTQQQVGRFEIAFANLDELDAGDGGAPRLVDQARTGGGERPRFRTQAPPIGYETARHVRPLPSRRDMS